MEIYTVGGAVRDECLGIPVKDRDYVVVGATPEQMMARGYRPVGRDFPVFLHPQTQEEYALARTERKTARGYRGFQLYCAPDVTLEQDLARRALTINAMARAMAANGEVDALVAERVWQEIARGLMEKKPSRMFAVLRQCGAASRLLPEIDR